MRHDNIWTLYEGSEAKQEPPRPLVLHEARLPDPTTIPPRQWLYGTQLVRGYVTVLIAPGGTGKSAYAMGIAVSCAAYKAYLGDHIFAPVNAAIFNLEDPLEEMERRLAAIMMRHQIPPDDLRGRLYMDDGEGRGLTMAAVSDGGFNVVYPDETLLIEEITRKQIGVLVCDPFAESHSLEENSNPQMVKAAAAWRRVARATGCAILLVHHVRKGDATGIDAARGAKALTDSARVGLLLATMSAEDGETFNIPPDDRWQYVRLDDAKRNMAPAAKARWFKLDQVSLGNVSDPIYPNGDKVAAIVPWEPPSLAANATPAQLNEVLDIIAQPAAGWLYAAHRRGKQNDRWAGQVLVDVLGFSEKQATGLIAAWLKSGLLYQESYHDSEQRKDRTGVRVDDTKRPTP